MKPLVVGLMVVRNEADIVAETVPHACARCDLLLLADGGSQDGTPEIMARLAPRLPNLILAGSFPGQSPDEVRRLLWLRLHRHAGVHFWWIFIDADEFIDDDLHALFAHAARARADHFFSRHANFYYTKTERQRWLDGAETIADRNRPIAERRRRYVLATSMPRAFRQLPWIDWREHDYFPRMSSPARERILYRHYQYRDWDQIRLRIETRRTCASAAVLSANPHWLLADPLDAVSPDDDPRLIEWKDGEPLRDDPALPPVARSRWKPLVKYAAAIAAAPFRRFPTGLAGAGFAPDLEKNFTRLSAVTSTTFARLPA